MEFLPPRNAPQIFAASSPSLAMVAGATRWLPIDSLLSIATVESRAQINAHIGGIIRNASIFGTCGANDATFTLRVNGASTSLVITMPGAGGKAWFTDLVNEVQIDEGDLINWEVTCGAGAPTCYIIQCQFFPIMGEDSQYHGIYYPQRTIPQKFVSSRATGTPGFVGILYFGIEGRAGGATTENRANLTIQHGGTLRNLRIYAIPDANDSPVIVRVNGVNSSITTTITGGAAEGVFTDLINIAEVNENDTVNLQITGGAGGTLSIFMTQIDFIPRIP